MTANNEGIYYAQRLDLSKLMAHPDALYVLMVHQDGLYVLPPSGNAPPSVHVDMPDPTPEQVESPEFEAIWKVIKTWGVNVPECYDGYCGANGSHVALILNALRQLTKGH